MAIQLLIVRLDSGNSLFQADFDIQVEVSGSTVCQVQRMAYAVFKFTADAAGIK